MYMFVYIYMYCMYIYIYVCVYVYIYICVSLFSLTILEYLGRPSARGRNRHHRGLIQRLWDKRKVPRFVSEN